MNYCLRPTSNLERLPLALKVAGSILASSRSALEQGACPAIAPVPSPSCVPGCLVVALRWTGVVRPLLPCAQCLRDRLRLTAIPLRVVEIGWLVGLCPTGGTVTQWAWPGPAPWRVSKAAADLMAYCDAHIREDPLIVPVPASENPFREKKFFCTILSSKHYTTNWAKE
ncbi:hypothetical protein Z043_104322 [Scleropages formosus]|uniref:Guanine nucleotide-binding protein subunit gamma n=1 Tax=Scleropages formosus TaxID=113540 RepID=A0A0P7XID5_SCLFO|nr:hypothetical protein Z043_104322 [Scleropages formosus]